MTMVIMSIIIIIIVLSFMILARDIVSIDHSRAMLWMEMGFSTGFLLLQTTIRIQYIQYPYPLRLPAACATAYMIPR